jgi:hypothetical protein
MLSDVLVPLLTYPDVTAVDVAAMLPDFVAGFAAHVTFLPVEVDVPDLSNRWGASLIALPQMIADVEARSRQAAHQLKQATIAAKGSVTIHHQMVRVALGQTGPALLPFTRYHDLCLLPTSAGSAEKAMLAETIIFGSGRPVMVAPERDLGAYDLGAVAIGWDGGSCASRAVFDALPILAGAHGHRADRVRRQAAGPIFGATRHRLSWQARHHRDASRHPSAGWRHRPQPHGQHNRTGRRTAGHGRLWPQSPARIRFWRRHQNGAARPHSAGIAVALSGGRGAVPEQQAAVVAS